MAEPAEDIDDLTPTADHKDSDVPSASAEDTTEKIDAGGSSSKRNAFAELMSPKSKVQKSSPSNGNRTMQTSQISSQICLRSQRGLLPYIQNPESFPPGIVLRATPNTVLIKDMFPKATVHLLLLPPVLQRITTCIRTRRLRTQNFWP